MKSAKKLVFLGIVTIISSCSSTRRVWKEHTILPDIYLDKGRYKSIQISDLGDPEEVLTFEEKLLGRDENRNNQEFKIDLEKKLVQFKKLKVIHMPSEKELIKARIALKNKKYPTADLKIYGKFIENSGVAPYSNDDVGRNSNVVYVHGQFKYKIVDTKTNKVLVADRITRKWRESVILSKYSKYPAKEISNLRSRVRQTILNNFLNHFRVTKKEYFYEFKVGKEDRFKKVINLASQKKYQMALKEQEKLLPTLDTEEKSDAHFNRAILASFLKNKSKASESFNFVKNGFMRNDRDLLARYMENLL